MDFFKLKVSLVFLKLENKKIRVLMGLFLRVAFKWLFFIMILLMKGNFKVIGVV